MDQQHDNLDDAMLVQRVRAGERDAFGPLLQRHYASVIRLCQRLLGSPLEAQDIAQEAALQAFLGLHQLHEPARFGAWLHAIAANLARIALRRRRSTISLDSLEDSAAMAVLWAADPPTPEAVQAHRDIHDAIVAALNELSTVNREVAIGFYLEGYSYAELAALLGVPVSTIKGRLFFGRRQLRQALQPLADEVLHPDRRTQQEHKMEPSALIEVQVDSTRITLLSQQRVVMLHETGQERYVPIWIGSHEAEAIAMALQGFLPPRPLTHDLALHLIAPLGGQVQRVVVSKLVDSTFFAELTVTQGEQSFSVDARPSDAIALAVRSNAPIYVTRDIFDGASLMIETRPDAMAPPAATPQTEGSATLEYVPVPVIIVAAGEVRDHLSKLFSILPEIEVVGEASSEQEVFVLLERQSYGVVVMDVELPDTDGIAATRAILAKHPSMEVILIGSHLAMGLWNQAMPAGARLLLSKPINIADLVAAVQIVNRMNPARPRGIIVEVELQQRIDQLLSDLLVATSGTGGLLLNQDGSLVGLQGTVNNLVHIAMLDALVGGKMPESTTSWLAVQQNLDGHLVVVRLRQGWLLALVHLPETDTEEVKRLVAQAAGELEAIIIQ